MAVNSLPLNSFRLTGSHSPSLTPSSFPHSCPQPLPLLQSASLTLSPSSSALLPSPLLPIALVPFSFQAYRYVALPLGYLPFPSCRISSFPCPPLPYPILLLPTSSLVLTGSLRAPPFAPVHVCRSPAASGRHTSSYAFLPLLLPLALPAPPPFPLSCPYALTLSPLRLHPLRPSLSSYLPPCPARHSLVPVLSFPSACLAFAALPATALTLLAHPLTVSRLPLPRTPSPFLPQLYPYAPLPYLSPSSPPPSLPLSVAHKRLTLLHFLSRSPPSRPLPSPTSSFLLLSLYPLALPLLLPSLFLPRVLLPFSFLTLPRLPLLLPLSFWLPVALPFSFPYLSLPSLSCPFPPRPSFLSLTRSPPSASSSSLPSRMPLLHLTPRHDRPFLSLPLRLFAHSALRSPYPLIASLSPLPPSPFCFSLPYPQIALLLLPYRCSALPSSSPSSLFALIYFQLARLSILIATLLSLFIRLATNSRSLI
ncbi:hypothetical protein C7M84_001731 [Penaeus vannamei]|uniref:Uncharacterized protein n=1 Tax=Penaeus vannamei TaxID=6689 RepID=A0A3R7MDA5_PENVA|nr:hypothetical protein C7M84_001731 [Penaeus vannamei]